MDQNQPLKNIPPSVPAQPATPTPELPKQPEKLLPAGHGGSWGAFIGIVIIILVLVVGALYFWGAQLEKQEGNADANTEESTLSDFEDSLGGFEELDE